MTPESTIGSPGRPLRLVIAGGGSGGHISPAIATLEALRARAAIDPLWIGSSTPFEAAAARDAGVPLRVVRTGKLRRYLSLQTVGDTVRVPLGVTQAWRILGAFRPDVVFSTGGFVSVPTVVAARWRRIPTLTHEQTAYVGLATRINARFADVVALSFEQSRRFLAGARGRFVVTGNPVRASVLHGDATRALQTFGLPGELPLVYVTGGAQGARAINRVVGDALPDLLCHVEIVHQCGPRTAHDDADTLALRRAALPVELQHRYVVRERVGPELGDLFAAAAIVVGRAGAGTIAELAAVGLPSILVPLPGAEEQRQNALYLVEAGAAVMLPQDQLTADWLAAQVHSLTRDLDRLAGMAAAARAAAPPEPPAERLADELLALSCASRPRRRRSR